MATNIGMNLGRPLGAGGALVVSGGKASPTGTIDPWWQSLFKPNMPGRALDPSGHYIPAKTIGGSGIPTAGGVTQMGATTDVEGGMHAAPTAGFGFDPYGSLDRIGNVGGEMAPASPNADPDFGTLRGFDEWNSGRNGYSGSGKPAAPAIPPNETGEQAYNRIFGRAKGGDVKEIQPYIVGEKGPELFIPEVDGKIIPHEKTMKMLQPIGNQPAPTPTIPEDNPELLPPKGRYVGGGVHGYPGYGYRRPIGGRLQAYGSGGQPGIDELVQLVQQLIAERGGQDPASVAHGIAQKHVHPYQGRGGAQMALGGSETANVADALAGSAPAAVEELAGNPLAMAAWAEKNGPRLAGGQKAAPAGLDAMTQAMIDDPNRPYTEGLTPFERYRDMGIRDAARQKQGVAAGRQAVADTYALQKMQMAPTAVTVDRSQGDEGAPITAMSKYGVGTANDTGDLPAGNGFDGQAGSFTDWLAAHRKALRTPRQGAIDPFSNDPRVAADANAFAKKLKPLPSPL